MLDRAVTNARPLVALSLLDQFDLLNGSLRSAGIDSLQLVQPQFGAKGTATGRIMLPKT